VSLSVITEVGSIAGRVKHAENAVAAGVDFVVAQGSEAGGHTGQVATMVLLPQVVDAVGHHVPVVAAGGIFDGRGLAAALTLGASGVWIGTRFLVTPEAHITQEVKEVLVAARAEDTVVTKAFTGRTLRALKNKYQEYYDAHPEENKGPGMQTAQSTKDGCWDAYFNKPVDMDKAACPCGQNVGCIDSIKPAEVVVHEMARSAVQILSGGVAHFSIKGARKARL